MLVFFLLSPMRDHWIVSFERVPSSNLLHDRWMYLKGTFGSTTTFCLPLGRLHTDLYEPSPSQCRLGKRIPRPRQPLIFLYKSLTRTPCFRSIRPPNPDCVLLSGTDPPYQQNALGLPLPPFRFRSWADPFLSSLPVPPFSYFV